jgi:hypothetical protein
MHPEWLAGIVLLFYYYWGCRPWRHQNCSPPSQDQRCESPSSISTYPTFLLPDDIVEFAVELLGGGISSRRYYLFHCDLQKSPDYPRGCPSLQRLRSPRKPNLPVYFVSVGFPKASRFNIHRTFHYPWEQIFSFTALSLGRSARVVCLRSGGHGF